MSGLAALVAALSGPNAARGAPQAHGVASVATGPVYGPYAARQWRGTTIWQCPGCPFPGTSADAVARHIAAAHPTPPAPEPETLEERADRSGIILATR